MSLACKWKGKTAWAPGSPGPCRGVSLSVESGLHELALRVSLDAAPAFLCRHSPVLRKARCRLWLGGLPPGVCTGVHIGAGEVAWPPEGHCTADAHTFLSFPLVLDNDLCRWLLLYFICNELCRSCEVILPKSLET